MAPAARRPRPWSRALLVATLFATQVTNYFLRTTFSVAIEGANGIAAQNGWGDAEKGLALSAFFYGYICQWAVGMLMARIGARRTLVASMALQACLSLAFPWCSGSLALVMVARALDGVLQGAFYPALGMTTAAWFDGGSRGRAYAAADCGNSVGAVLAMTGTPLLMASGGWPLTFVVGGCASALVAVAAAAFIRDRPPPPVGVVAEDDDALHAAPRTAPIVADGVQADRVGGDGGALSRTHVGPLAATGRPLAEVSGTRACKQRTLVSSGRGAWTAVLCSRNVLFLCPTFFCETYTWYVFLTFLPLYCEHMLGFSLVHGGSIAAAPYLACVIGVNMWAALADCCIRNRTLRPGSVRKLFCAIGLLAPSAMLALLAAPAVFHDIVLSRAAVVAIIISANFVYSANGGGGARPAALEMAPPEVTGVIIGFANAFGNVAGIVAPILTGWMLQRGACPLDHRTNASSTANAEQHAPSHTASSVAISPECTEAWAGVWATSAALLALGATLFVAGTRLQTHPAQGPLHEHATGRIANGSAARDRE